MDLEVVYSAFITLQKFCREHESCRDCPLRRVCDDELQVSRGLADITLAKPPVERKFEF